MRKMVAGILMVGVLLAPVLPTEAGREAKRGKNTTSVVQDEQVDAVAAAHGKLTATASAHTERSLISEEAPDSIREGDAVMPALSVSGNAVEHKMRPGEQLQIVVYGHEDLTNSYAVRPDGNLTLPLIGDVNCTDKTVPQVTQEITNRLAEYIIDPQVTINVTQLGSTRVYVMGEVRSQGIYELQKTHTLLDAVASAGGFTQRGAKRKVYVVRQGVNDFVTKVNVLDILRKGAKNNIDLQEGDCVYVSSNHKLGFSSLFSVISHLINTTDDIDDLRNNFK